MTRVLVAGAIANKPGNGGEAWVRMTWLLGLRRLGVSVAFVEEFDASAWGSRTNSSIAWWEQVVKTFRVDDRAVLLDASTGQTLSGTGGAVEEVNGGGFDLLVNISGHLRSNHFLAACRRRAYVDIDPGYTQMWHAQGADLGLERHDVYFTTGTNIGLPLCTIPTAGLRWIAVLPPVLLAEWETAPSAALERCTTVASWRGGFGRLEYEGRSYGIKAHEFRKIIALPRLVDPVLELALDIHPTDLADEERLAQNGWRVVDPTDVARDPMAFRRYVQGSDAEFSVAQGVYVDTASGWFSDRTAHYLAAGRPTIVQDTGFAGLPELGVVPFTNLDEAAAAIRRVSGDYAAHADAARQFARDHLDSDAVLGRVLDQALTS